MFKRLFFITCMIASTVHSIGNEAKIASNICATQTDENIELSFDEGGMLNIRTSVSPISLVRLFNHDGKKISLKPESETKLVVLKDKLPSGSSWYVQIKTIDGKSNLRKITKP